MQSVVLPGLQRKGREPKEAFLLKAFLVTFDASKVTKPPRQLSGWITPLSQNNNLTLYISNVSSLVFTYPSLNRWDADMHQYDDTSTQTNYPDRYFNIKWQTPDVKF